MNLKIESDQALPATGFLRLPQILGSAATRRKDGYPPLIPVSKATWWEGVRSGRFPKPVKLGPNTSAWRVEDIRTLIQQLGGSAQ
ncbi:helix-turn-helix transcriptional regulator [Silanimonas algicola]